MAKKEANIVVRLRDRASSGFRKLSRAVGKVLKPLGLLTTALTAVGAITGGLFLRGAIRSAGQFDEAMSTVGAVTNATAAELDKLRTAADEASARTRFTAEQAANGLEELSRAGFSASESVKSLNPVLDLAAGNNQSVAESAIQVTTALNAFGLAADQAGRVSDVYTRAAQRSAQTTSQLGQAMTFVAPVARQAGLSVEEAAGLVGRLADAGFRGSRGGTALRNALSQLQDPTSAFSAALSDAGIQSRNFIEVIEQLAQGGDRAEAAIRALGLEAAPAIQSLVDGGVPQLQSLITELNNAEDASKDAAAAMEDNLPGAIRAFNSAFDQARRRLVAPLVIRIKEEIQDLTVSIREFTSSGVLDTFSKLLVEGFNAAVRSIKGFVDQIDFSEARQRIIDFAKTATERLKRFASDAADLRRSFDVITGSVQAFAGALSLAFNAAGTVVAATFQFINFQLERHLKAVQRFTLGLNPLVNRALAAVQDVQRSLKQSTDEFAASTVRSFETMATGIERLNARTAAAAEKQKQALEKTGEAANDAADATGRHTQAVEVNREEIQKHLAVVRGWDAQLAQANETTGEATESQRQLGEVTQETGEKQATAGEQAEAAGEQQEQAAEKALTAWLDFGDGIEAVTFQVNELAETAANLDQLRQQAEAATPPIDRLREAIAAASSTDQLDNVVATMGRLREEGLLTEEQYRELTDAVLEQAEAMREATTATDEQADSLNRVSREAVDAAGNLEKVGNAARGAGAQAKGSAQGFGAILDSWRELGPDASAQVDRFIEQQNAFAGVSFSVARGRLARFTRFMEDRFGNLRDATREAREEAEDFERGSSTGTIRDGNVTLTKDINLNIEVKRDPQGPLQLSEADMSRIVGQVVAAIEGDQARSG